MELAQVLLTNLLYILIYGFSTLFIWQFVLELSIAFQKHCERNTEALSTITITETVTKKTARQISKSNTNQKHGIMSYHLNTTDTSRNPIGSICPLDTVIQVGFGTAKITKNGKTYYDGETEVCEPKTLAEFEKIAQKEPGNWKLVMEAPLWDATWERHSENKWVCIKAGRGFA